MFHINNSKTSMSTNLSVVPRESVSPVGNAWIICRSKTYAGRTYYFNTSTGETVWNLSEPEMQKVKAMTKNFNNQSGFQSDDCPEPVHSPEDGVSQGPSRTELKYRHMTPAKVEKQVINNQFTKPYSSHLSNYNMSNGIHLNIPVTPSFNGLWNLAPQPIFVASTPVNQLQQFTNFNQVPVTTTTVSLSNRFKNVPNKGPQNKAKFKGTKRKFKPKIKNNGTKKDFNRKLQNNVDLRLLIASRKSSFNNIDFIQPSGSNFGNLRNANTSVKNTLREKYMLNDDDMWLEENLQSQGKTDKLDATPLKKYFQIDNIHLWYIIADSDALLNNVNFLNILLNSDKQCRLIVPQIVMTIIQEATNSRLRTQAHRAAYFIAQQLEANLASIVPHDEDNEGSTDEKHCIITCCSNLMKNDFYVIILTDCMELNVLKETGEMSILTINEIKKILTKSQSNEIENIESLKMTDSRNIKITIPNTRTPLEMNTDEAEVEENSAIIANSIPSPNLITNSNTNCSTKRLNRIPSHENIRIERKRKNSNEESRRVDSLDSSKFSKTCNSTNPNFGSSSESVDKVGRNDTENNISPIKSTKPNSKIPNFGSSSELVDKVGRNDTGNNISPIKSRKTNSKNSNFGSSSELVDKVGQNDTGNNISPIKSRKTNSKNSNFGSSSELVDKVGQNDTGNNISPIKSRKTNSKNSNFGSSSELVDKVGRNDTGNNISPIKSRKTNSKNSNFGSSSELVDKVGQNDTGNNISPIKSRKTNSKNSNFGSSSELVDKVGQNDTGNNISPIKSTKTNSKNPNFGSSSELVDKVGQNDTGNNISPIKSRKTNSKNSNFGSSSELVDKVGRNDTGNNISPIKSRKTNSKNSNFGSSSELVDKVGQNDTGNNISPIKSTKTNSKNPNFGSSSESVDKVGRNDTENNISPIKSRKTSSKNSNFGSSSKLVDKVGRNDTRNNISSIKSTKTNSKNPNCRSSSKLVDKVGRNDTGNNISSIKSTNTNSKNPNFGSSSKLVDKVGRNDTGNNIKHIEEIHTNKETRCEKSKIITKESDCDNVMFEVTSQAMENYLKMKSDEWVSRFVQIMDEVLTQMLQQEPKFVLETFPPPWTVYEAVECIKRKFIFDSDIVDAATKLLNVLFELGGLRGKIKNDLSPEKYMEMYSFGVYLIDALQGLLYNSEDLQAAAESLSKLLSDIQNPHLDPCNQDSFVDLHLDREIRPQDDKNCENEINAESVASEGKEESVNNTETSKLEHTARSPKRDEDSTAESPKIYNLRSNQKKMMQDKEDVIFIRHLDIESSFFSSLGLRKNVDKGIFGKILNNTQNEKQDSVVNEDETPEINAKDDKKEPTFIRNITKCMEFEEKLKENSEVPYDSWTHRNEAYKDYEEYEEELDYELMEEAYYMDGEYSYNEEMYESDDKPDDILKQDDLELEDSPNDNNNVDFKLIVQKMQSNIKETYTALHEFCKKSYEQLSSTEIDHDKYDIVLAEKTYSFIENLCNTFNKILERETSDTEYKIQEVFKNKEFEGVVITGEDLKEYRRFINNCLVQGNVLKESVRLVMDASKEVA